jgi:hypothetical protein
MRILFSLIVTRDNRAWSTKSKRPQSFWEAKLGAARCKLLICPEGTLFWRGFGEIADPKKWGLRQPPESGS